MEDVRRAFYDTPGTPVTYWITELQLDPPQLIVCDEASANIYRIPVTINGADISFGTPVPVEREYTDVPAAKTAAAARWGSPVAARAARPAEPGRRPARGAEAKISAAIADGKIPQSRAAHYRALAAAGDDLAILDQLAAGVPAAGPRGAAEDPEDATYRSIFGGPPGSGSRPVSAAQASEDAVYRNLFGPGAPEPDPGPEYAALFPTVEQDRARADARAVAAAKAVSALSDDEIWGEMFGKDGSR